MKPYQHSPKSKKEQVQSMFDGIARRYDLLNHLLSLGIDRGWRRQVVRKVQQLHPSRIVDMATGTADLAILLAKACPEAHVTGIDLSEQMLAIGRRKVAQHGLNAQIQLEQGDAEAAMLPADTFDAATVAFGVRNFEHLAAGITGLFKALHPGGHLFVLEFGVPQHRGFRACFRFYFHRILPFLGGMISKDSAAYTYLPESVDEFPYGARFLAILQESGFQKASYRNLFGGVAQLYEAEKPKN